MTEQKKSPVSKVSSRVSRRRMLQLGAASTVVGALSVVAPTAHAATKSPNTPSSGFSPVGNWSINANGYTSQLQITSMNQNGVVYGAVFGNPLVGFWDAPTRRLSFIRAINLSYCQSYLGTLDSAAQRFSGTFEEFYGPSHPSTSTQTYAWKAVKEYNY
ncbi:MAG TPA: hypothetical protein VGN34_06550 [Ktedonobacteraceae bacterium]|jgi:hypothetical protein